jgi:hypothetical protein
LDIDLDHPSTSYGHRRTSHCFQCLVRASSRPKASPRPA